MSTAQYWNDRYVVGNLPWDSGEADDHLVSYVASGGPLGRVLEIGCGTGTNARFLADRGAAAVLAVDIAPQAIAMAQARGTHPAITFAVHDIHQDPLPPAHFDLIYDRGCFHVFDDPALRDRFAATVAAALAPGGRWLSLIGCAEGAAPLVGPPRRTLAEAAAAIEPHLRILTVDNVYFDQRKLGAVRGWRLLAGHRD